MGQKKTQAKFNLDESVSVSQSLKELPTAIKDLATRWTFLFICLEQSCEAMLLAGFGAFVPKIIESQFSLSPAMAAVIVGKSGQFCHISRNPH